MGKATLALIARDLIRSGNSVHAIAVAGGRLRLHPVASWDVRGDPDPDSWSYRIHRYGPWRSVSAVVPAAAVVHCRYAIDAVRPWSGIGPLQWATATGTLAGRVESNLAAESNASPALLLPVPSDGQGGGDGDEDADPLAGLKGDLAKAKGRAVLVETTAAGWGQGAGGR